MFAKILHTGTIANSLLKQYLYFPTTNKHGFLCHFLLTFYQLVSKIEDINPPFHADEKS